MGHMKDFDRRIRQGGDDAIAAVSELMPQWISVEERLPEEGRAVLVWNNGGDCPKPWAWWQICRYRDGEWREQDEYDEYPGVTHWQPLPSPPEVK